MDEEGLTFYKPASGLPTGLSDGTESPSSQSAAPRYSVRTPREKESSRAFSVGEGAEKAVEVTVNPQGKCVEYGNWRVFSVGGIDIRSQVKWM